MKRSLPLGAALAGAVAFLPRAWLNAWGALVLLAAVLSAPGWMLLWPPAAGLHGAVVVTALAGLTLIAGLVAEGALYRLGVSDTVEAARRKGLGLGGLQFGAAELRLVAAGLLVMGFLALVALALGLVLAFVFAAVGVSPWSISAGDVASAWARPHWPVVIAVAFVAACGFVLAQLLVRLSLYKAATVARGRIVSLDALAFGEGNLWRLLAGLIATLAPTIVLTVIAHTQWALTNSNRTTFLILAGLVEALAQVPLTIGFLSSAHKRLEYWSKPAGGR